MRIMRSLFVNPFTMLLVLMFLAVLAASASAETPKAKSHKELGADPKGYDAKYPKNIGRGPMSVAKIAEFGLKPVPLRYEWKGYNYHREVEGGRWILETLPAGTLVAVDDRGNQIYKVDCANRLVWLDERSCPVCAAASAPEPGIARRIWDFLWKPIIPWPSWSWVWPYYYRHVTIDVAGPNGPYTIDSYGSHRVVVAPHGDGHVTFDVTP